MSILKKVKAKPVSKMRLGDIVREMQQIVQRDPVVIYPMKVIKNLPEYSLDDYNRYHELMKELNTRV